VPCTGIAPTIFRLLPCCLNHLCYSVSHDANYFIVFHGHLLYIFDHKEMYGAFLASHKASISARGEGLVGVLYASTRARFPLHCLVSCVTACVWTAESSGGSFVHRRLPTAAARFRGRIRSCETCGVGSRARAGFPLVLRFPLSIIPPAGPYLSSIIRRWYNRANCS
jgi:hypothetical protein